MKYLFIYEDGSLSVEDRYEEDELKAIDAGVLQVIGFIEGHFYELQVRDKTLEHYRWNRIGSFNAISIKQQ